MERQVLSVEEAAQALGIGRQLAYELARRGELPGVRRIGRRLLVSKALLLAYLEKPEPVAGAEPR